MRRRSQTLVLLVLLGGCAQQNPVDKATPATVPEAELDDAAWTQALIAHREEIDEELRTSPTSPMAGTQYLKSEPADRVYLTRQDRTFSLAYAPDSAAEVALSREAETWVWEDLSGDVVSEIDDEPVAAGSPLPGPAAFEIAGLHLGFYPAADRVTFIVYDPERPEKKSFERLLYFPPDRSYAVPAELVKIPEPDEIEILTSRNLKKTYFRYAKIRFRVDGTDQELTALKSRLTGAGSESLFIPFRDSTAARETYGAGRFMDLDEPQSARFVLDFNRSYNPLCNYSPAFNCPIPPRENRLQVAIRAGELAYPH